MPPSSSARPLQLRTGGLVHDRRQRRETGKQRGFYMVSAWPRPRGASSKTILRQSRRLRKTAGEATRHRPTLTSLRTTRGAACVRTACRQRAHGVPMACSPVRIHRELRAHRTPSRAAPAAQRVDDRPRGRSAVDDLAVVTYRDPTPHMRRRPSSTPGDIGPHQLSDQAPRWPAVRDFQDTTAAQPGHRSTQRQGPLSRRRQRTPAARATTSVRSRTS
jgi:hypothetical protein